MHKATWALAAVLALGLTSCHDSTSPRVSAVPAAPRGVRSVTGDQGVTLSWLSNTESGITGYRVYEDSSATPDGPYYHVGTTSNTSFVVTGLANGRTLFFAVSAVGPGGESPLSYETVYDTPRPAGTGAAMVNLRGGAGGTGWDFSAALSRPWTSPLVDVVYSDTLGFAEIYAADNITDIQDAGYATTLDAVDYAPTDGWSPTGSVEAIQGHCYVVWTADNHFAKFRVTSVSTGTVVFDWAYQTDAGNGELRAQRSGHSAANLRQAFVTQR